MSSRRGPPSLFHRLSTHVSDIDKASATLQQWLGAPTRDSQLTGFSIKRTSEANTLASGASYFKPYQKRRGRVQRGLVVTLPRGSLNSVLSSLQKASERPTQDRDVDQSLEINSSATPSRIGSKIQQARRADTPDIDGAARSGDRLLNELYDEQTGIETGWSPYTRRHLVLVIADRRTVARRCEDKLAQVPSPAALD